MPQASEHRMSRAREQGVITSQPKATSKLLNGHRAPSQEHRTNGFSATSKLRPLPPRPSPLDDRCKKLELDRGRASKRSDMRASASRRGPVKADHALKVPGCAPNLLRSKSISIGDLSQASSRGEEQLGAVLSRLALQDRSPSSSSLRRVNVAAGLDGRPPTTLLSVRTEASSCSVHRVCSRKAQPGRESEVTHHTLLLGSGHIGLRNLGNTCFMNAVLQCLSSTKPLRDYCLRREFRQEQPGTLRTQQELTEAFADVIATLWHPDSTEAANPSRFKAVFQKYVPSFTGYSQQDAQEFLKFLMDRLHVEINRKGRRTPSILSDAKRPSVLEDADALSDDEQANQMWKRYLEREDSKIVDLFVGQLKSCLKCQACGYRSTTFEVFCDLSLPIPKKGFTGGKVSLLDCFSLFAKEEELDSENAPVSLVIWRLQLAFP
uniref:ubiquitinyl hydrolase 1 n=1 Tax=Varanus komodoensis TaxID=61221 RepID=A0A8D2JD70_VARKO